MKHITHRLIAAFLAAAIAASSAGAWADQRDDFLAGHTRGGGGCDLAGANFKRRDLSGANLAGANLKDANFHDARLTGATLAGADLTVAPQHQRSRHDLPFVHGGG
jgi:uncharacterized protein YjbI with pentapeptide repeats